jgi:hypothetical protein
MCNIRNPFGGGDLALQSGRALQCPHDPALLLGIARVPTAKTVMLFMTIDLLCCAEREIFRPSRGRQSGRSPTEIESN